jgi:hypothetical protein
MSRIFEWERRAQAYGNQGRQVTNPYEAARVRASRRTPGPLTTGQKIFREISYFAIGGLAFRGIQGIHYGIKGAHGVALRLRSGKHLIRFRDRRTGRFVSEIRYRHRRGLPDKLLDPVRGGRAIYRKATDEIADTRIYRGYSKVRSVERFLSGPEAYLIHRYTPSSVKVGLAIYGGYRWLDHKFGDRDEPETIQGPLTGPRAELNFILNQRLPPTLGGISRKKSGLIAPHSRIKSQKRCPPGHRWSSRLRKCVRVNRRRA